MKESEAKKKWCPFADSGYLTNKTHFGDFLSPKCLGSDCMAWVMTENKGFSYKCPKCGYKGEKSVKSAKYCKDCDHKEIEYLENDFEGYCQRLKDSK